MNWSKASAIAEITSSVAVVITLVYLLLELQQNTDALEASTRQAALDNSMQTLQVGIDYPELWLSRTKETLTETERVRLSAYLLQTVRRGQVAWQQYQAGALDEAGWEDVQRAMVGNLTATQPMKWWNYYRDVFPDDFRAIVDDSLKDQPIDHDNSDVQAFE